jgi:iron-sulfur cluster repair protein YtfE (RIC family)
MKNKNAPTPSADKDASAAVAAKDACDLLDADHLAVKHLLVEYARLAMEGTGASERLAYARKICQELTVHAQIEEEIFYPALRESTDAGALLDLAESEHQQAKDLIAQIEPLEAADATMDDLVSQLACAVEQHVKEERTLLFPKARSAAGLDLLELGSQLQQRQQELNG